MNTSSNIFLLLLFSVFETVKSEGKLPVQDLQNVIIQLKPKVEITSRTNLSITVINKFGNYIEFAREDLLTISTDFNKKFSYSPVNRKIQIELRNFKVNHIFSGIFIIYCVFEMEVDEDTHWEVLWLGKNGEDIPMTTFFVKSDLPTVMEVICTEAFGINCNRLTENEEVTITCMIKTGMPFLTVYLELPPETSPVILLKNPRRIESKIKLVRSSQFKALICGANGQNLTVKRPFEFSLEPTETEQKYDSIFFTIIVTLSSIIAVSSVFAGIYLVLVKPSKERGKEKVIHHVEIAQDINPARKSSIFLRNSMAIARESRKSLVRILSKRSTSGLN